MATFILSIFFLSCLADACLADAPPLRLATLEYPPYITQTDRGAQGLAVDIVHAALTRMGRAAKIDVYPVARGQQMLATGEVDGFFSIKRTPEREKTMVFPRSPLLRQDYVFFVPADSRWRFDGDFESISAARIGVVNATSYGSRFDNAVASGTFRQLEAVSDHETNFRKLLAHRVNAVICSRLVGNYYLEKLGGRDEVVISGPVVETTLSYLVFAPKSDAAALARQFDEAMDALERDGTVRRLTGAHSAPSPAAPKM